jgi:hypothetical protein
MLRFLLNNWAQPITYTGWPSFLDFSEPPSFFSFFSFGEFVFFFFFFFWWRSVAGCLLVCWQQGRTVNYLFLRLTPPRLSPLARLLSKLEPDEPIHL